MVWSLEVWGMTFGVGGRVEEVAREGGEWAPAFMIRPEAGKMEIFT